jgi:hypothetical protein
MALITICAGIVAFKPKVLEYLLGDLASLGL